jgi:hypothetical protein
MKCFYCGADAGTATSHTTVNECAEALRAEVAMLARLRGVALYVPLAAAASR